MPKTNNLQDYLQDLYEGISSKKPNASKNPQDFRNEIENLISTGDATAKAADIRLGKTAYANDIKLSGTIEDYDGSLSGEVVVDGVPTGTLDITEVGVYNVTDYAAVDVNISGVGLWADYFNDYIKNANLTGGELFNFNESTSLDAYFEGIDTSGMQSMYHMFYACKNLTHIPQFDTSNVWKMSGTFESCSSLKKVVLNTDSAEQIGYMFYKCSSLEVIDLTSLDNVTVANQAQNVFGECPKLKTIIIRNMTRVPTLGSGSFANAGSQTTLTIYVPDNMVDAVKAADIWKTRANYIKPLSELEVAQYDND